MALDCAAVALKFASRGNAYERNEARVARRREHEAALIHEREIHDARNYGEAMAKVVASGIEAAAHDEQVARASAARASAVLRTAVVSGEESPGLHKGNGVTGDEAGAARGPRGQPAATDRPADATAGTASAAASGDRPRRGTGVAAAQRPPLRAASTRARTEFTDESGLAEPIRRAVAIIGGAFRSPRSVEPGPSSRSGPERVFSRSQLSVLVSVLRLSAHAGPSRAASAPPAAASRP